MARDYNRDAKIKIKKQTRRDELCIWHFFDGSDSSCSRKPLDEAMKKRTGCTHERTECYGSPTACRYKELHTPQSDYSTKAVDIDEWKGQYPRPDWFPLLMGLSNAGAEKVFIRMMEPYYSLEVFVTLPLDPNKKIGVMIEIANMHPDLCLSILSQDGINKADVRLLFKSPDEKKSTH